MRRTTLGNVTDSRLNIRASMGPMRPPNPRSAIAALKPGEERRQSAMPSYGRVSRRITTSAAAGRRATSSAVSAASSLNPSRASGSMGSRPSMTYSNRTGMRSDPRPLHDKQYMQQCVKALISFVIDRGYDQPISPKILTNPSARDFQNLFLFLVRSVDPTYEFQKRFEDEVPIILRSLGYPFTVSKSNLSAVGSPHTWPGLLGVLMWLMGLIKYDEARRERENADHELDPMARRMLIFYNNMVQAYHQFLAGDDAFPQLDEQLNQLFDAENSRRQDEISKLEADRDQLAITLQSLQSEPSPLQLSRDHKVSLETNIHKFELLIPSLVEHDHSVQEKLKKKGCEIEREDKELGKLKQEREALVQTLGAQEEAGIDAERLVTDKEHLKERLHKLGAQRAQAENEHRECEQKLSEAFAGLDDCLQRYQTLTSLLESAGRGGEGPGGKKYEWQIAVSRDAGVTEVELLLSKNIGRDIIPGLRELKEQASDMVPVLQEETVAGQERIDEAEERLIVQRSELSLLESRKEHLEGDYQKKRGAIAAQLESRKQSILQRETQMSSALYDRQEEYRAAQAGVKNWEDCLRGVKESVGRLRKTLARVAGQDTGCLQTHEDAVRRGAEWLLQNVAQG